MRTAIYDTEANGLHEATKIWCIVVKDQDTGVVKSFGPNNIRDGIGYLCDYDRVVCHNQLDFDRYIINKLYGIDLASHTSLVDTLVLSRLSYPDRPAPVGLSPRAGPHSLEAWGLRFGVPKPKHEDWTQYSDEMLHRCQQDVEINHKTYEYLLDEMKGHDWSEACELEKRTQEIVSEQARRGVYFDLKAAEKAIQELSGRIAKLDVELEHLTPYKARPYGVVIDKIYKADGQYRKNIIDWYEQDLPLGMIAGEFTRIFYERMNLSSDVQVKELLFKLGWQPVAYNYNKETGERTSPKLEFADGDGLDTGLGKMIKDRKLWSHRLSQIQGWVKNVRPDCRIEADGNPCGTPTRRFTHRRVVNVPKAGYDKEGNELAFYGNKMRALFTASPGRKMVGYDLKGIELRLLAHFMGDQEYIDTLLNGDIHVLNQELAGLPTRDHAKTFIYAFNYGAGDAKLGSIVGGTADAGRRLRREFLRANPALEKLIRGVKRSAGRGFLRALDGGVLRIRRGSDGRLQRNKALNTLLQGNGAVVHKKVGQVLYDLVKENKLDAWKVIDMHDEAQWDVKPKDVERFTELVHEATVIVTRHFNMNLPIEADVKVGKNWAETH